MPGAGAPLPQHPWGQACWGLAYLHPSPVSVPRPTIMHQVITAGPPRDAGRPPVAGEYRLSLLEVLGSGA